MTNCSHSLVDKFFLSSADKYSVIFQDVEEEEEEQVENSLSVREKIREALEVGVRRMNLNAAAGGAMASGAKEPAMGGGSGTVRRDTTDLDSRMKKLDRLQSQIEQSFRSVKKELLKGSSQGELAAAGSGAHSASF